MDGFPALDLYDLVIEVFHCSPNQTNKTKDARVTLKLVGKNKLKHANTNISHEHQSPSD